MQRFVFLALIFCVVLSYTISQQPSSQQPSEVVRRAVFDIGSGSTKMLVADVNIKTGAIVKVIHEESEQVSYQLDLDKSKDTRFSQDIRNQGLLALSKLKWIAIQKGATQFAGVATSAFRKAGNGQEFAIFITKVLGIYVHVITQQKEAILGYYAAVLDEEKKSDCVVWDIGGGSMQIIALVNNKYEIYQGKVASQTLATYIIEKIQNKDVKLVNSPNPISQKDYQSALEYVKDEALKLSPALTEKFNNPNTKVLGIGGVHYYSVRVQINKDAKNYTLEELTKTLENQLGKTDAQIGGQYASTEVGNLILVKGFMEVLDIKNVKTKKSNIAHGMLFDPSLWK